MATTDRMDRPRTAAAYVALAIADTSLAAAAAHRAPGAGAGARRVTKPLLMPTLAWAFGSATRGSRSPLRRATLLAQGLSGVGDVALLGQGNRAFLTGLSGFLGAHAAYVGGFLSARDVQGSRGSGAARGATAVFLVAGPAMGWAAGRTSPRLRLPVVGYAGALCAMTAAASRVDSPTDPLARRTLLAGTTLFLLSDGTLGAREFLDDGSRVRRRQLLDVLVMASYTAAQGLIATGVARVLRAGAVTAGAGVRAAHDAGTSST